MPTSKQKKFEKLLEKVKHWDIMDLRYNTFYSYYIRYENRELFFLYFHVFQFVVVGLFPAF